MFVVWRDMIYKFSNQKLLISVINMLMNWVCVCWVFVETNVCDDVDDVENKKWRNKK